MSYLWLLCSPGSCGAGGAHNRQADHRLCDGDLWHVLDSVADIGRLVAGQGEFLWQPLICRADNAGQSGSHTNVIFA